MSNVIWAIERLCPCYSLYDALKSFLSEWSDILLYAKLMESIFLCSRKSNLDLSLNRSIWELLKFLARRNQFIIKAFHMPARVILSSQNFESSVWKLILWNKIKTDVIFLWALWSVSNCAVSLVIMVIIKGLVRKTGGSKYKHSNHDTFQSKLENLYPNDCFCMFAFWWDMVQLEFTLKKKNKYLSFLGICIMPQSPQENWGLGTSFISPKS